MFTVACKPCREWAVRRLDGVVTVVDADNDAHSGNPPCYNRYKMENLKTNWKLSEKIKNPRSQREISCEEIENILKIAGFILFFLKKIAHSPAKFQKAAEKVGIKVGKPPKNGWKTL